MAGKGHKKRPLDPEKFGVGYDRVFGKKPLPKGGVRLRCVGGTWYRLDEAPVVRKNDATNLRSKSLGCFPKQIGEFGREFGDLGVKFDPVNGDAIIPNRQAKLAMLKRRGMHDCDEIRG